MKAYLTNKRNLIIQKKKKTKQNKIRVTLFFNVH